jgi:hypothetical protein
MPDQPAAPAKEWMDRAKGIRCATCESVRTTGRWGRCDDIVHDTYLNAIAAELERVDREAEKRVFSNLLVRCRACHGTVLYYRNGAEVEFVHTACSEAAADRDRLRAENEHGQCSRHAEGCQGGWGENQQTYDRAEAQTGREDRDA